MAQRWILHADMDAFYASVEQRDFPELRGKPVIVGANSARGVVAAASYEARRFGVHSAMPGFRARQLCPHAEYRHARMDVYGEVSARVRQVFAEFTPEIEPLALDEAFLDVTGSLHFFSDPKQLAQTVKRRVKEATALNVSVGMGPNKLVAKLACTLGKPNGLKVVPPGDVLAFLAPLPIRRLWGVGPVTAEKLQNFGIQTIGQLADYNPALLTELMGSHAPELQARARGEDHSKVESARRVKSCGEENTFESDVLDREVVQGTLTAHAEAVARRLRHLGLRGRTVTLKIKLAARRGARDARNAGEPQEPIYPVLSRSKTLSNPTDDDQTICDVALELWDKAKIKSAVRLLGVTLSNFDEGEAAEQLELFGERQKPDPLGPTLDRINERFGKAAIRRAVDAPGKITPSLHKRE